MKLNFQLNLQQFNALLKYRGLLTIVAVVGLVGYTTYQVSQIGTVQPDQQYIKAQTDKLSTIKLKINPETIQKLKDLQSGGDTNIQIQNGKNDPFSFN